MRRVLWLIPLAVGGVVAALSSMPARAEHFDIILTLRTSKGIAEARWDTSPPSTGVNPRQSVTAAVGEDVLLEWELESEFPHGVMKDVVIHTVVVPEEEVGQKEPPPASTPRLLDNSFTADFQPHHKARGHVRFRVTEPGAYLVRLDSDFTLKEHGHEHFAALDLKVE